MANLQQLIHRRLLINSLVSILVIEITLLALYFGINSYTSSQRQEMLTEHAIEHLDHVLSREAYFMDVQLAEVEHLSNLLRQAAIRFYTQLEECKQDQIEELNYLVDERGVLFNKDINGNASLYYAATTPDSPSKMQRAVCSEVLDPVLKDLVTVNPAVTQAYYNTWDNMVRIYPFLSDISSQFGPDLQVSDFNFYYLADSAHNPSRGGVWTGAYEDPAGQGWMISNIYPVYKGDFLEGVTGLDITLDSFIDNVMDISLPWMGAVIMIGADGNLLAMPERAEDLLKSGLSSANIKDENEQTALGGQRSSSGPSLSFLDTLVSSEDRASISEITVRGKTYLVDVGLIERTGWRLVTLVDRDDVLAPVMQLQALSVRIGWLAVAFMVSFYAVMYLMLRIQAHRFSRKIADPIENLSMMTTNLGTASEITLAEMSGVTEIDRLSDNFNQMTQELNKRSQSLIEKEIESRMVERENRLLLKLATTDQLTGLSNRRKLSDVLGSEVERASRYQGVFGILLIDLDSFKEVNDTYGHQIGDKVLQQASYILEKHIRETDIVGRWGGEEFLVICPESSQNDIMRVAEKLNAAISKHFFEGPGHLTISIGVSSYLQGDNSETIVSRADSALYKAKSLGKNQWAYEESSL